jgi:hypothetical protein
LTTLLPASRLPLKGSDFTKQVLNTGFLFSVAVKIEVLGFNAVPDKIQAII